MSAVTRKDTRFVYQFEPRAFSHVLNGFRYTSSGLQPLPGFPVSLEEAQDSYVQWVAPDPLGRFVYFVTAPSCDASGCHGGHMFLLYRVDQATGVLTFRQSIALSDWLMPPVPAPNGRDIYFATNAGIAQYRVDPELDSISLRGYFPVGEDTDVTTIDASGTFLIASSNSEGQRLRTISLDPLTGEPTKANPAIDPGMMFPGPRFTSPDGKYLFVGNAAPGNVQTTANLGVFSVSSDGVLSPVTTAVIGTSGSAADFALDGLGRFLYGLEYGYASNPMAGVQGFTVDSSGLLSSLSDIGAPTPHTAQFPGCLAASRDGRMLFVNDYASGGIHQYQITPSGQLSDSGVVASTGQFLFTLDMPTALQP